MYANDRDTGENAKVEYRITSDPSGLFSVNRHNGWVTAARPIFGVRADNNINNNDNNSKMIKIYLQK